MVGLQEETMEPVVVNEERVSLPDTGDIPVDVRELYVPVMLVLPHTGRPHTSEIVTGPVPSTGPL